MACCTGGFCNIPQHHHTEGSSRVPQLATKTAATHGRNMGGMMNCSMSCCQDPDKPVVSLGGVCAAAGDVRCLRRCIVTRAVERVRSIEIPRTIEPLSPPPRTDNAALCRTAHSSRIPSDSHLPRLRRRAAHPLEEKEISCDAYYRCWLLLFLLGSAAWERFSEPCAGSCTIRNIVRSPMRQVTLQASKSAYTQTVQTDAEGQFHFDAVPLGEYVCDGLAGRL